MRHTNIYERDVGWGRRGLDPKTNRSHQFYAERVCAHFKRTALSSLNKAKTCLLRPDFMAEVQRAVEGSGAGGGGPVLLLGPPGSGKSSTLARVSQLLCTPLPRAVEVMHFIGLTGESRNIRLVLQSLCVQLAQAYASPEPAQLSTGVPQLVNEFRSLLSPGAPATPPLLLLLLDGLDELWGAEQGGTPDLSWLEGPLPPHTSPHTTVLSIPPLGPPDVRAGLERGLRAAGRRLRD
ncbi:hypothetical protein CRUP_013265, partial [Coryphaenoides rupestris]